MRLARWRAAAAGVACLGAAIMATPASARPILDDGDAAELANRLAEATEEQGICYGWEVDVQDDDGTFTGIEQGSSLAGAGAPPRGNACRRYVIFVGLIRYTSATSESPDSADFGIESNVLRASAADDLRRLGVDDGALLGDRDDVALMNAIAALPALVAEKGLAPPVGLEATSGTIPASDRPTGVPGSDRLRTYGVLYAIVALLLLAGLGWIAYALFTRFMNPSPSD